MFEKFTDSARHALFLGRWIAICDRSDRIGLLYRTFDYGDSAPTVCGWWAVDRNENVFCYREYYQANALTSTHRANIAALSVGEREELPGPIFHITNLPQLTPYPPAGDLHPHGARRDCP